MQYRRPDGECCVGDCMPRYHEGVFQLYWLPDEKQHQALDGHRWEHVGAAGGRIGLRVAVARSQQRGYTVGRARNSP